MRVKVKYNNFIGKLYLCFNIFCLVALGALYFIDVLFSFEPKIEKTIRLSILCVALFLIVFNAIVIAFDIIGKRKIVKQIKEYVNQKDYDAALEYLKSLCQKKRTFSTNQLFLFYLGSIELKKDNFDDGLYYLEQFDLKNQRNMNAHALAMTILYLYIAYLCKKDEQSLERVKSAYEAKKKFLSTFTKDNKTTAEMLGVLDCLINNDPDAALRLKEHNYFDMTFIQRFAEEMN